MYEKPFCTQEPRDFSRWEIQWAKYILFANTNLAQYIDGTPLVKGMTMPFSLAVLLVYFVAFNAVTWWTFQKRDVAA
ncbi:ABC-type transport system involved in multi-copper enzyme maturation permease subunit [Anoxybacillus tepidamans]|uniref:ABC-type transport system involved in multi-copper enzyme maturation permease subunit n=1 Tax=Anoxybacteroides tepidamans TaxID=265948 RepID=A0A7W8IQC0_9BACL|nr:ABC-type transport system involved in multi-copper enzyme maturation permease subunit [Anoxybacillus tepidamans]